MAKKKEEEKVEVQEEVAEEAKAAPVNEDAFVSHNDYDPA